MPNLSIKDVPEALAEALRQRAAKNHRSLQGELMALLEAAVQLPANVGSAAYTLGASESAVPYQASPAAGCESSPISAEQDDLLERLDAIVANSQWGSAPLLTREQLHDRRLLRELEYDARRTEEAV